MGFFYGGNIAGAVVGCLLAGFYLLREFDVVVATLVAVAINAADAALAYGLSKVTEHKPSRGEIPLTTSDDRAATARVRAGTSSMTCLDNVKRGVIKATIASAA